MSDVVVQACPVVDELVTEDGAVVLTGEPGGHRVMRLSVLGQLIRELTAEAISIERLVVELESRIGSAPDTGALELVRHAVAELQNNGLVALHSPDERETRDVGTKRD